MEANPSDCFLWCRECWVVRVLCSVADGLAKRTRTLFELADAQWRLRMVDIDDYMNITTTTTLVKNVPAPNDPSGRIGATTADRHFHLENTTITYERLHSTHKTVTSNT
ncbi:hypothetical protein DM01DRAFT_1369406 [Hesseltinella vesiculosa]|uniref:Uncharacterized protein n=1 Tax=Hesseltinella vesiculosa TaxID=101127 RepID=A0A1X2GXR8_9FUNG|nr:hypothetical protein DM01DRAFT_1369406 [Hesseltinella vesiculosa]